jgi:hypothetical protein
VTDALLDRLLFRAEHTAEENRAGGTLLISAADAIWLVSQVRMLQTRLAASNADRNALRDRLAQREYR